MTDDAPTPDGTHHDEDAVAAPQTADDRPSLPEDDSPVLSTTTPDTAGEPRPEDEREGVLHAADYNLKYCWESLSRAAFSQPVGTALASFQVA